MQLLSDKNSKMYFEKADKSRFEWLTKNRFMLEAESLILERIKNCATGMILEVGCGEGANIYNSMGKRSVFVGLDLCHEKVKFASLMMKDVKFICADAAFLPFGDNHFDLVFCRDVLHHLADKTRAVREISRVLKPGKSFIIIEANGMNFIWKVFGMLFKAERGVRKNTAQELKQLFLGQHNGELRGIKIDLLYVPLFLRLVTHYRFGLKSLGNNAFFLSICKVLSRYFKNNLAQKRWPYIIITGVKKDG